ncbi:hypothetical protein EMIT0357P_30529 [Pseudomonas marginalis]|jgi:hypothetical protein
MSGFWLDARLFLGGFWLVGVAELGVVFMRRLRRVIKRRERGDSRIVRNKKARTGRAS